MTICLMLLLLTYSKVVDFIHTFNLYSMLIIFRLWFLSSISNSSVKWALRMVEIQLLDHLILTYEEKYAKIETNELGTG